MSACMLFGIACCLLLVFIVPSARENSCQAFVSICKISSVCVCVCAHAGKHPPPFQQSRDVQYPCGTDGSCGPRAWQGIVQDDTSRTAGTKPHQQAGSRRNAQLR